MSDDETPNKSPSAIASVGVVGIQFGMAIAIGIFGGRYIDSKLGTSWVMWLGFALGMVSGAKLFWIEMKRMQKLMDVQDPDAETFPYKEPDAETDERDAWPEQPPESRHD